MRVMKEINRVLYQVRRVTLYAYASPHMLCVVHDKVVASVGPCLLRTQGLLAASCEAHSEIDVVLDFTSVQGGTAPWAPEHMITCARHSLSEC
jgi:hypothetical protein